MTAYRRMGMKLYVNELGQMITIAAIPIYGKTIRNILLQKKMVDGLGSWFIALGP